MRQRPLFGNKKGDATRGSYVDGGGNLFVCASGACCYFDDSCGIAVEALCSAAGGTYQGDNTICDASTCCPADVDGDGVVGIGDFLLLLAQWGPCPPNCIADLDGDGTVGILDFLLLLANWRPCP